MKRASRSAARKEKPRPVTCWTFVDEDGEIVLGRLCWSKDSTPTFMDQRWIRVEIRPLHARRRKAKRG